MNDPPAILTSGEPAPAPLLPARVSLQFLFVWTTVVAIAIALAMAAVRFSEGVASPLMLTVVVANSLMYGGCVAAWLYAFKRWRGQAIHFPTQPGHFLALLCGVQYVYTQASILFVTALLPMQLDLFDDYWSPLVALTGYALHAVGWLLVGLAPFQHRAWKVFCGLCFVACVGLILRQVFLTQMIYLSESLSPTVLFAFLYVPQSAVILSILVAAIVAIAQDLWRWRSYDWLHWLGLGGLVYVPVSMAATIAAALIDSPTIH